MTLKNTVRFYAQHLRWRLFWIVVISLLFSVFDALSLALLVPLYQWASWQSQHPGLPFVWHVDFFQISKQIPLSLGVLIIVVVGGFALKSLCRFVDLYYRSASNAFLQRHLRLLFIRALHRVHYAKFVQLERGKLQNVGNQNIQDLHYGYQHAIALLQSFIFVLIFLSLSVYISWQFTLLLLVGGALVYVVFSRLSQRAQVASKKLVSIQNQYVQGMGEMLQHFSFLKATQTADRLEARMHQYTDDIHQTEIRLAVWLARLSSWREPVFMLLLLLALWTYFQLCQGSLVHIIPALMYSYRAFTYMLTGHQALLAIYKFSGPMDQYITMLQTLQQAQESDTVLALPPLQHQLQAVGITYVHASKYWTLHPTHLHIEAHQMVALIGPSGSGKTTLSHLMMGLLTPSQGVLIWDGISIQPNHVGALRQHVGWVHQDQLLFEDSIFNNITLWDPPTPVNVERFHTAIAQVGLSGWIQQLPLGKDQAVGAGGNMLSGGQKQRLAIARALYLERSWLILDEPTSALDAQSEHELQELWMGLKQHATLLVIAHRLSTVQQADRIYFMEEGRIVAAGTHAELLAQFPKYRQWIAWQTSHQSAENT